MTAAWVTPGNSTYKSFLSSPWLLFPPWLFPSSSPPWTLFIALRLNPPVLSAHLPDSPFPSPVTTPHLQLLCACLSQTPYCDSYIYLLHCLQWPSTFELLNASTVIKSLINLHLLYFLYIYWNVWTFLICNPRRVSPAGLDHFACLSNGKAANNALTFFSKD